MGPRGLSPSTNWPVQCAKIQERCRSGKMTTYDRPSSGFLLHIRVNHRLLSYLHGMIPHRYSRTSGYTFPVFQFSNHFPTSEFSLYLVLTSLDMIKWQRPTESPDHPALSVLLKCFPSFFLSSLLSFQLLTRTVKQSVPFLRYHLSCSCLPPGRISWTLLLRLFSLYRFEGQLPIIYPTIYPVGSIAKRSVLRSPTFSTSFSSQQSVEMGGVIILSLNTFVPESLPPSTSVRILCLLVRFLLSPCAVLSSSKRPFVIYPNSRDCYPHPQEKRKREKNLLEKNMKKKKKRKSERMKNRWKKKKKKKKKKENISSMKLKLENKRDRGKERDK